MDTTKTHKVTVITSTKDTTTSKSTKDTTVSQNTKTNSFEKYTVDTVTIKKDCNCDWVSITKDLSTILVWPILIFFIIIIFKEQIANLIGKIKEISFGKDGFKLITKEEAKVEAKEEKEKEDELERQFGLEGTAKIKKPEPSFENKMTKKILSTFWKNQRKQKNENIRWSFALSTSNPEYEDFIYEIKNLIDFGYVKQDILSQQFYLTKSGINFCRNSESELTSEVFKL